MALTSTDSVPTPNEVDEILDVGEDKWDVKIGFCVVAVVMWLSPIMGLLKDPF